ncbi:MAG: hypothetical protein V1681_05720 [Candidatus Neomarinimicrobiota bacterium]
MAINRTLNRNLTAKKTEPEVEVPPVVPELKVNFGESGERLDYIRSKLDDIMLNIGQSYSDRLTKELIHRLEKTIVEFHSEVISVLNRLEKLEAERENPEKPLPEEEPVAVAVTELDDSGLSEWERRLEERERENKTGDVKPVVQPEKTEKVKKGLFRRKQ